MDGEDPGGAWLTGLRKSSRLSQVGLAGIMRRRGFRWHPTTVQRVEAGARPVRLEEAEALADIFRVPLADLRVAS